MRLQDDQQDYQLINSVYLDNSSMELYHGRLDKRPNAIALRIRCPLSVTPLKPDILSNLALSSVCAQLRQPCLPR